MNLRLLSVVMGLVLSAMLLGTVVYQNVVDAPNYLGAPTSLETTVPPGSHSTAPR